jgi:hypothetical protein
MSGAFLWLIVVLFASPAIAYGIYRLAQGLGFLDPPVDRAHELRRTILASLFAFLLLLPVGIYGFEKGWPRVWILFGLVDCVAIVFFGAAGIWAALQLWRLRHPEEVESPREVESQESRVESSEKIGVEGSEIGEKHNPEIEL